MNNDIKTCLNINHHIEKYTWNYIRQINIIVLTKEE
jgi:hypothetical protein